MVVQAYVGTLSVRFRLVVTLAIIVLLAGCVSGPAATTRDDVESIDILAQFDGFSTEEIIAAG